MSRDRHIPNVLEPFEAPYASRERRAEVAAGLRELATWIETTHFPIPTTALWDFSLDIFSSWIDDEGFLQRIPSAIKLIGGRVQKDAAGGFFELARAFAGDVKIKYNINREAVCEATEAIKIVTEYGPLDTQREAQLRAELEALEKGNRPVARTVKEYDCPQSLLSLVEPPAGEETTDEDVARRGAGRITVGDMLGSDVPF